jgi:hypothetical protein
MRAMEIGLRGLLGAGLEAFPRVRSPKRAGGSCLTLTRWPDRSASADNPESIQTEVIMPAISAWIE